MRSDTPSTNRVAQPARKPLLLMYWGGGFERTGGIGRMVGSLLEAGAAHDLPYEIRCIDTRGPHSIWVSPLYFVRALLRTGLLALSSPSLAAHVMLAAKGSTVRKLLLCRLLTLLRVPYLLHLQSHNYDSFFDKLPQWAQRQVRRGFAEAARVVVLGQTWRQLAVKRLNARPEAVRIIRNGTRDPARLDRSQHTGTPTILMLGDVNYWKGVGEMIEALSTPDLRARPWRLVCAGSGEIEKYRDAGRDAGIADRIHFTGWISRAEAAELLASATVLALPSYVEGLSVTLTEALAYGLPVIATPVGAHSDILVDGQNALLVPPRNAYALALALRRILDDPDLAAELGRNGRRLFESSLDIADIERQFDMLYAELFALGRPPLPDHISTSSDANEVS